jgi:hypothetical protein
MAAVSPRSALQKAVPQGYTGCMKKLRYDISFWNTPSVEAFVAGEASKFHEVTLDGTDDFGEVLIRASEGSFPGAHGVRPHAGETLLLDGTEDLGMVITADVREADDAEGEAAVQAALELLFG